MYSYYIGSALELVSNFPSVWFALLVCPLCYVIVHV